MLRVALTGPESTGKTTLSQQLATQFRTSWAPEYARAYLTEHGPHYTLSDLEEMAHGQLRAEEAAVAEAEARHRPVMFCDTDLLVIKIWAEHSFGYCPDWIVRQVQQQRYDLVLLLNVDLPWQADPLREHPHHRAQFYALYQSELRDQFSNFAEISGEPTERFEQACFHVDELLARHTPHSAPPRSGGR